MTQHEDRAFRTVALVCDPAEDVLKQAPVCWALEQLQAHLKARDVAAQVHASPAEAPADALPIVVGGRAVLDAAGIDLPDVPEALALVSARAAGRLVQVAWGSDVRGLVYALLELADRVEHAPDPLVELGKAQRTIERPANRIRSVARLFTSEVEDLSWYHDKSFWEPYLSTLISQRFNRFNLTLGLGYNSPRRILDSYFYFPYPFLLAVPGYDVKAVGLDDADRDRNMAMLQWISEQVVARGLDFQLALWTHAHEFIDSPDVNYPISGLTPETHAAYCNNALNALLEACPAITGVTFRAHSESGVPHGSFDFWRAVFNGIGRTGRRIEIDIHAKCIDQELIDVATDTGLPVNISPKHWAEHMGLPYHQAAIRQRERVPRKPKTKLSREGLRGFTRYGYADYLAEDRPYGVLHRIWPGTQRLLLWGDPAQAAGLGRCAHFCDSVGVEICEPLSFKGRMGSGLPDTRDGYADPSLHPPGGDWEKYLYSYRLWGRLMYNPDAPRESWGRYLTTEFGPAAGDCEAALAHASRVLPLITVAHHPSASNNVYWPEMYSNQPIANPGHPNPYGETPDPKTFGAVSPLDPAIFVGIDEFADELLSGKLTGRISPLEMAARLDGLAAKAEEHLDRARQAVPDANAPAFRRLAADVAIQIGIARFFAHKYIATLSHALGEKTGDPAFRAEAIRRYRIARDHWAKMATDAKAVYVADVTFGQAPYLRGHWADRLADIDQDLADMEAQLKEQPPPAAGTAGNAALLAMVTLDPGVAADAQISRPGCLHLPPACLRPGRPLHIEMAMEPGCQLASARLHYRHVNQAEEYQILDMTQQNGRYKAEIPGEYTDSPYPLMYYFELHDPRGDAWLHPGLAADLANQPYFVVRRA